MPPDKPLNARAGNLACVTDQNWYRAFQAALQPDAPRPRHHAALRWAPDRRPRATGRLRAASARKEAIGNSSQVPQSTGHRKPRPYIPRKATIDDYSSNELVELVRWVISDGQLRTDEQIMEEILPELGFSRRGVRIETAIRDAIRRSLP